jgi:hypothetical protein
LGSHDLVLGGEIFIPQQQLLATVPVMQARIGAHSMSFPICRRFAMGTIDRRATRAETTAIEITANFLAVQIFWP